MNATAYGLVMMAVLIASTSGQITFTAGTATCVGCFRSAIDCAWDAGAVNLGTPTLTPRGDEGCAALCMINPLCTHYTYSVLFPGTGYCSLKSAAASVAPSAPLIGPTGIGSSCGWMFGRSLQTSPPGFIAPDRPTSALTPNFETLIDTSVPSNSSVIPSPIPTPDSAAILLGGITYNWALNCDFRPPLPFGNVTTDVISVIQYSLSIDSCAASCLLLGVDLCNEFTYDPISQMCWLSFQDDFLQLGPALPTFPVNDLQCGFVGEHSPPTAIIPQWNLIVSPSSLSLAALQ